MSDQTISKKTDEELTDEEREKLLNWLHNLPLNKPIDDTCYECERR